MGRFLRKRRGRCGPRGLVPYREVAARMGREGGGRRADPAYRVAAQVAAAFRGWLGILRGRECGLLDGASS